MGEQREAPRGEPEEVKREKIPEDPRWLSRSYSLGAISSFLSTFVTFPIYKAVFRQQIHAVSVPEAVHQLQQEGLHRFYRGIYPPLLAKTLQGTLLFGIHDNLLQALSPTGSSRLWHHWVAGFLSGAVEAVVLTPFERVQNVLQDGRKDARFPSTSSILREFHSYGLWERLAMGYYRGFLPVLLRNSLGSALYFSFKDPIRDGLAEQGLPCWVPALVAGSVNGTLTCLLLYPLSVLVANMQSQVGWQEAPGLRASAQAVWEDRGRKLLLIYRGGSLVILRSCVTWGLTTAIHDFLQESNCPRVEESD
ncbi:solute carrier family 25 member 53 [Dromiciops gliroides]|uniref:solute carrier family 25 member 53 n=1 Tax=Dromiciops gliroides TaxID=33562 RepID=UPI001CC39BCA|nr:solute carrier family 25 member 53 [Dromiciops gliroides]